jgi:hypothetical protein
MLVAYPMMRDMENMFYMFLGNSLALVSWILAAAITSDAWKRFYKEDEHAKEHFKVSGMSDEDIRNGASPNPSDRDKRKRKAILK